MLMYNILSSTDKLLLMSPFLSVVLRVSYYVTFILGQIVF